MWALLPDFWNRWRSPDVLRKGIVGNKGCPDHLTTARTPFIRSASCPGPIGRFGDLFHGGGKCPPVSGCDETDRGPGTRGGCPGRMHHSPFWFLSPKRSRQEIQESLATLQGLIGVPVRCFQPPWGMSNLVTHYWMRKSAQKVVLWPLDSLDWFFMTPAKVIIKKVSRWVRPTAIILFHDGPGVRRNAAVLAEALPQLLENMLERRLIPVTVSELIDEEERMRKIYECRECRDESVVNRQALIVLRCSADQCWFMQGPVFTL